MSIETLLRNLLLDKKVSNPRLNGFGSDMINKIDVRNNNNLYPWLPLLQTSYNAFKLNLTNKAAEYAVYRRMAGEQGDFIAGVHTNLISYESILNTRYGVNSKKIMDYFPSGRTEFSTANRSEFELLLNRLDTTFGANALDFPVPQYTILADVHADATGYSGKKSATSGQLGLVKYQRGLVIDSHTDFAHELFRAILRLMVDNYKDLQKVKEFMSLELLYPRSKKGKGTEPSKIFSISVPPLTTVEAGIVFTDETVLSITPDMDVDSWTGPAENTPKPDNAKRAIADIQNVWKAYELGAAGNRYLFFYNPDETDAVDVEILYL